MERTFLKKRIIIIGPSGVGKSTLIEMLLKIFLWMRVAVSCTTRELRKDEVEGKHYYKITDEEFARRKAANLFAETDEHHGAWYGTLHSETSIEDGTTVFDVEVNGATNLKKLFPNAVTIFIHPPSKAALKERIEKRVAEGKGTLGQIPGRLERYEYEASMANTFDYQLVNDNLFVCFAKLAGIIFKELGGTLIAIDGKAGSGKGTLAKKLAEVLAGTCLDSGLMYRFVAYHMQIIRNLKSSSEELKKNLDDICSNYQKFQTPESLLRSPEVDAIVPLWSQLSIVRDAVFMLQMKAAYGSGNPVTVAEGRDMTTNVFKEAQVKFFVDCPLEVRAKRRAAQTGGDFVETMEKLKQRDHADMTRPIHPLFFDKNNGVIPINNEWPLEQSLAHMKKHIVQTA